MSIESTNGWTNFYNVTGSSLKSAGMAAGEGLYSAVVKGGEVLYNVGKHTMNAVSNGIEYGVDTIAGNALTSGIIKSIRDSPLIKGALLTTGASLILNHSMGYGEHIGAQDYGQRAWDYMTTKNHILENNDVQNNNPQLNAKLNNEISPYKSHEKVFVGKKRWNSKKGKYVSEGSRIDSQHNFTATVVNDPKTKGIKHDIITENEYLMNGWSEDDWKKYKSQKANADEELMNNASNYRSKAITHKSLGNYGTAAKYNAKASHAYGIQSKNGNWFTSTLHNMSSKSSQLDKEDNLWYAKKYK